MIHPAAIISPTAQLAAGVSAGPCAIIEDGAVIGEGCRIEAHGQVLRGVVMGARNIVGRGAVIGGDPQALSFDPAVESGVRIGDGNTFREHVTVHRSTQPGGQTVLGNNNYLMASSHVGHDAVLGDHNVLANGVLIAGHIVIGSRCFFGGGAALHQFIRVGDYAMVQGCGGYTQDIPPFCTVFRWNNLRGLNVVGLRRAGFDSAARRALKQAWRAVYLSSESPVKAAHAALETAVTPEARQFLAFIAAAGPKGVACYRPRRSRAEDSGE
jgi:UDP-N-acetylglucosamine acyltransferase